MASLGVFVYLLQLVFGWVMPFVGLGAVLWLLAVKAAPYLPSSIKTWIAKKRLYAAIDILGPDLMLVREEDGRYTLAPYRYDADNGVYWVDYGDEEVGFDAGGMGGQPLPFANGTLGLAYQGLGAVADVVSARIGYEANQRHGVENQAVDGRLPPGGEAVTDGGTAADVDLEETEVAMPENGFIADLRNVLHLAPYHIRPSVLKRVEKNAKASQQKFGNWGAYAQMGGMMAAFFLGGLLVWFVTRDGGGGGNGVSSVSVTLVQTLLEVV